jgi:hypothetical protein
MFSPFLVQDKLKVSRLLTVRSALSLTLILLMWRIGCTPNSIPIYSCIQLHATLHGLFISGNCSTCFGWYFHPPLESMRESYCRGYLLYHHCLHEELPDLNFNTINGWMNEWMNEWKNRMRLAFRKEKGHKFRDNLGSCWWSYIAMFQADILASSAVPQVWTSDTHKTECSCVTLQNK